MIRRLLVLAIALTLTGHAGQLVYSGLVTLNAQERPALTADEQKDREILALKVQLTNAMKSIADLQAAIGTCQGQLGPYQLQQNGQALEAEKKALVERVEKRTGFTWNADTGTFGEKKPAPDLKKN